ncbi:DEAD/DEAH box helicase [uncultured Lamprocystis sp.]|jgi:type III restriction enzyme|uniref:DEAD/DEAH box helicase n=3 Tax=uncultured Lamprocystis sp. TaxID=543132 RepID=UPI0025F44A94|nr:DEAD/DEAH box helicase family protein [uncultured Lamprocystis sp.]
MSAEKPSLMEQIRAAVDAWRGSPLGGAGDAWTAPGRYEPVRAQEQPVSETTAILLRHWFRPLPHELPSAAPGLGGGLVRFRYWPHQRRCVETLIYLHEVLGIRGVDGLYDAFAVERDFTGQDPWPKLGGQLATGSGKTRIMSLVIAWSTLNALREGPAHLGLGPQVLAIAPGLFVKERLLFDFAPTDRPSVFRADPVIPPALEPDWHLPVYGPETVPQRLDPNEPALVVTNIHQLLRVEEPPPPWLATESRGARQQRLLFETPEPKRLEAEGTPLLTRLRRGAGLLVINDEAHHVGDEPAHQRYEKTAANRRAVGLGGADNDAMAWVRSLRALHQRAGLGLQVDLSATLYEEEGGASKAKSTKAKTLRPFRHTVIDYPLREAIADGVVKHPVLERVRVTAKDGTAGEAVRANQPDAWLTYEPLLRAGIGRWQRVRDQLRAEGDARKPILFLLCADRHEAQEIANALTYGEATREDLSGTRAVTGWVDPDSGERLFVEQDAAGVPRSTVIQIHIGAKEEQNEDAWQKVRAAVNAVDQDAIRDPSGALDEHGEPRLLPNPYNVVISVMMLKEGWDVRNVKVIVPLRACDSRTLTEQTLGRGLRRMHPLELDEDGAVQASREELYVMQHPSFDAIIEEIKDIVEVREAGETAHIPEYCRIEPLASPEERAVHDVRFVYFLGERERVQDWRAGFQVADPAAAERLDWVESFQDREVQTYLREAMAADDADGQRFTLSAAPSFRDYDQVMEVAYALPLLREVQAAFAHKNAVKAVVKDFLERRTFRLPMGLPLSFDRAIEAGPESGRIALCNLLRPEVITQVRDALRSALREAIAGRPTERVAELREVRAADLAAYPARKQHELERTERSCFGNGAFDSADELRFAVLADRCPDVLGWLYNHRQGVGLRIEYDWQGHLSHYYPDFILRVCWVKRVHNLICEVKGRMDERDEAKARAGRRYAALLTAHDPEPWHYLLVHEDPKVGRTDLSWLADLAAPSMGALLRYVESIISRRR